MMEGSCLDGKSVASLTPGEEGADPTLRKMSELTVDIANSFGRTALDSDNRTIVELRASS